VNYPAASDVKVFVPAKNFRESLKFYTSLGWQQNWQDENLAELELSGCRFYLQNYYNQKWADNFMMHITVSDAKAWWEHAAKVIAEGKYQYARLNEPKQEVYGALVTYVWDPSGVLLHFAQRLDS
jgi:predicted lactoylglutathione lyase